MLEWIRHAYAVAPALDTDQKVEDLVSAIVVSTGEDEEKVRREVLGIIRDVRGTSARVART
jgi:hypothetical protein